MPITGERGSAAADLAFTGLKRLSLEDTLLVWEDEISDEARKLSLDRAVASAPANAPLQVTAAGELFGQAFDLRMEGGTPALPLTSGRPWPADLQARLGDVALSLNGTLTPTGERLHWDLEIRLRGSSLSELGRLAGVAAPAIGPWALDGQVTRIDDEIELTALKGSLDTNGFTASGLVDLSGQRPRVRVSLDSEQLDAELLRRFAGNSERDSPAGQAPQEQLPATKVRAALEFLDADVRLSIREVLNAPVELRDIQLRLGVSAGRLDADAGISLARVPMRGRIQLTAVREMLALQAALSTEASQVTRLAAFMTGDDSVTGDIKRLDLQLSWGGARLEQLLDEADLRLDLEGVELVYGKGPASERIPFNIDRLSASIDPVAETQLSAKGSLLARDFAVALLQIFKDPWLVVWMYAIGPEGRILEVLPRFVP